MLGAWGSFLLFPDPSDDEKSDGWLHGFQDTTAIVSRPDLACLLQDVSRMELAHNRGNRADLRKALVSNLKIAVWVNLALSLFVVGLVAYILRHPH